MTNEELKEEIALLICLGCCGLKMTPYKNVFKDKFNVDKIRFTNLKKMNIYELLARYSLINIQNDMKGENYGN